MKETVTLAPDWFKRNGFHVEPIAETQDERADFLVTDGAATYVVEEKGKEISDECKQLLSDSHQSGTASIVREPEYYNRFDGILRKANSQLEITPAPADAFRVVWISCPRDAAFIHEQFETTLYGKRDVAAVKDHTSSPICLPCFYFDFSSFYRLRQLDAVILASMESMRLCVNEFSQRSSEFRLSRLYSVFPSGAAVDPFVLESSQQALSIRDEIDRKDSKAKWDYLLHKYGFMTSPMTVSHFTGVVTVPLSAIQDATE